VVVAGRLTEPGIFGLVLAALTAALMSTIDTLITAVCALFVNDIWRPFVAPDREDAHYLAVARATALAASVIGVLLVPIFAAEKSIYVAHGKFIATVTPSMIVVILLSVFWKRFTPSAAFWTLLVGSAITAVSAWYPGWIAPFAHGVSTEGGYKFMRAFFGILVSLGLAAGISFVTEPRSDEDLEGLVIDSLEAGRAAFQGGALREGPEGELVTLRGVEADLEEVAVHPEVMTRLAAEPGDLVYVADSRWWYGGLRSVHTTLGAPHDGDPGELRIGGALLDEGDLREAPGLTIERVL